MTDHASPQHASRELDAILQDMAASGATARRAARRIRSAVDSLLVAQLDPPACLPVRLTPDVPPVTTTLANQLVVHHLGLASAYWEMSDVTTVELELLTERTYSDTQPALSLEADRAWLREMGRAYREVDEGEAE